MSAVSTRRSSAAWPAGLAISSTTPRLPWFSNSNTGLPFGVGGGGEGAPGRIAAPALDLAHLGAPVAHHRRGAWRSDVGGELDDLQAFKHRASPSGCKA